MKLLKCVAFLNVLNIVTGGKNKNILEDEDEVFDKINNKLTTHRSENSEKFWDSVDNSFVKINLTLNIDPNSNVLDKYLNLCSFMQKVTWGNKVFIKKINSQESKNIANYYDVTEQGDYLLLIDDIPEVSGVKNQICSTFPFDKKNIISKVLDKYRTQDQNFIVLTKKSVPIGSGLGGGSSDAAAVVNSLFKSRHFCLSNIGSDLPFLASECDSACVFGVGDKMLELYNRLYSRWVYLLIPFESISTFEVYKKARELLTSGKIPKCDMNKKIMESIRNVSNFRTFGPFNDLEKCVSNQNVRKLARILSKTLKRNRFGMSGSGCSFFAFADKDSVITSVRDLYKDPLIIVKTKFKFETKSHEFKYL